MPQSLLSNIVPEIQLNDPTIVELSDSFYEVSGTKVFMLRLDEIHQVISGNKIFKLIYFLQEAKNNRHKKMVTFGGAYSNHLAATAFACKELNLKSVGIVRGEKPDVLSPTLLFCLENGMELQFISRSSYGKIKEDLFLKELENQYDESIIIPEGGFSIKGKAGASIISEYFNDQKFTHVCLPVGTATTLAGVVDGNKTGAEIIGFGVLKSLTDLDKRLKELEVSSDKKYSFNGNYHFGGYGKYTDQLIFFMNDFYQKNKIPLDFVYTAKMMFGINDLLKKNYFLKGSKILCIHTGGLQGNCSFNDGNILKFAG